MVIKCVLDVRKPNAEGLFPVRIRLYQDKKAAYYGFGVYANEEMFDVKNGVFFTNDKSTRSTCIEYNKKISFLIAKFEEFVWNYSIKNTHLSPNKLKELIAPIKEGEELLEIDGLGVRKQRKITIQECFDAVVKSKVGRTNGAYRTTQKWITKFYGDKVYVKDMNLDWLRDFENKLANTKDAVVKRKGGENGLSVNAIGAHMKNLRAVLNHAIKLEMVPISHYPFRFYTIETKKTVKRAMPEDDIRNLFSYLPKDEAEKLAIDVCKMIFFSVGTSFKDLYHLTDFKDESMIYTRFKTKKLYNIYIHSELRVLLNEYSSKDGGLKLKERSCDCMNRNVNATLGYICEKIGIKKITTYSMRHSWATYANKLGFSYDNIRISLGHSAKGVTDTYIDYDMNIVKNMNRKIIDYVLYPDMQEVDIKIKGAL